MYYSEDPEEFDKNLADLPEVEISFYAPIFVKFLKDFYDFVHFTWFFIVKKCSKIQLWQINSHIINQKSIRKNLMDPLRDVQGDQEVKLMRLNWPKAKIFLINFLIRFQPFDLIVAIIGFKCRHRFWIQIRIISKIGQIWLKMVENDRILSFSSSFLI